MPCEQLGLLLDFAGGDREGGATHGRRSTSVRAPPHRRVVGIAVHDLHVAHADAELVGDDLRERRLLALTVRRRADEHVHLAGRMKSYDRAFPEPSLESDRPRNLWRPEAADLDVGRDADAEILALPSPCLLLGAKRVVVDVLQRFVEGTLIVPAVVLEASDNVVTIAERWDQIAPADLHRI